VAETYSHTLLVVEFLGHRKITILQLLAIDAGGTSTRAMVLDDTGTCLGVGRGGRGNPVSDGPDRAAAAIGAAVRGALRTSGTAALVEAVALAMAGGLSFAPPDWLQETLAGLDVHARVAVEPDLLAMFCSGGPDLEGYGVVAGTGATAVRVRGGTMDAIADGLGWLLGDSGSGFWIGHQVARSVALDLEGRGSATSLTAALLDQLGITPTADTVQTRPAALNHLVQAVYGASPLRLATFAPLAFADPHDEVSARIVDDAVAHLAQALLDIADPDLAGPLVIGGGVAAQPRVREGLHTAVAGHGITGSVLVVQDGLVGAGVLALRRAGVIVDEAVFARLQQTTAQVRAASDA
jgi:glucosamine kinase